MTQLMVSGGRDLMPSADGEGRGAVGCVGLPTSPPKTGARLRAIVATRVAEGSAREARCVLARMGRAGEMVERMTASQLASLSVASLRCGVGQMRAERLEEDR